MQVETTLNERVTKGLRAQFNQARTDAILSQAESMFLEDQFKAGICASAATPETYELIEGGWIDKATEFLGYGRWAIARPKSVTLRRDTEPLRHGSRGMLG